MAAVAEEEGVESFEDQVPRVKIEIETCFDELINRLVRRKMELLEQLEELSANHKRERKMYEQSLVELEQMLKLTKENVQSNRLQGYQEEIIGITTKRRQDFKSEWNSKKIVFNWDKSILNLAKIVGKLKQSSSALNPSCPLIKFCKKYSPTIVIGKKAGDEEGMFNLPYGVAIDYKSGNIFVSDSMNKRVQVFCSEGRYLYKFGDQDGPGKMDVTICIAIFKDRVFVGQRSNRILVYELDGNFIAQIGREGKEEGQFNTPGGIAFDNSNEEMYVCDHNNHRVQIFTKDFLFKAQFGEGIFYYPKKIILTDDKIYLITTSFPCFYIFTHNLTQVQNYLSFSISKHVEYPWGFTRDGSDTLIIPDNKNNKVLIYDGNPPEFYELKKGISDPRGVAIDSKGRLLLINDHSLLIY